MIKTNRCLTLVILFIPFLLNAYPRLTDTIPIKGIDVIAAKSGLPLSALPLSSVEIDRKTIEESNEPNVLPILSQQVPGLFVTAKGIMGFGISTNSSGTINIRGVGEGNKVLTMIDGQPQWAGIFGHSIADNWVSNNVQSIEVIKGPASLLYGSNAMGGSINIITRRNDREGISGSGNISYGSYNTQEYAFTVGYNKGKFRSFLSGNSDRTDGERKNSQFRLWNGFGSLQYDITNNWNAGATFNITNFLGHNPGMVTKPINDNWMEATRGTASVIVKNSYSGLNGSIQGYYNFGHHKINDGYFDGAPPRNYIFKSDDHVAGAAIHESFCWNKDNMVTVGYDIQNWGGHAWNDNNDGSRKEIIDKCITNMGAYAMLQYRFFNMISVNAGTRYEYNTQYGSKWIPQAGIVANIIPSNTIKFSFSEGFRAPNLRELYMYQSANPDLKPEDMYNYELSVNQFFLNKKINVSLALFYIDGKEMIQPVPVDGIDRNMNVGTFTNKGIEAGFSYRISDMWTVITNYSFLDTSKKLLAAPKHKLFAAVHFNFKNFGVIIDNETILGLYRSVSADAEDYDYSLLNASVSYKFIFPYLQVEPYVGFNNITDTQYSINEGFPMPGFTVKGGVKVRF